MTAEIVQLKNMLHSVAIQISNYTYDEDEEEEEEDRINDTYKNIEIEIATIENTILATLSPSKAKDELEYQLLKCNERYSDLKALYRAKKITEKNKYLESLYLKSFDKNELKILNGEEYAVETETFNAQKNGYNSIDDEQLVELTSQEKLLKQNVMLSDKLQNVNALMKSSLLAGEMNLNEFEGSTKSLSNLSDSYAVFGNVLNKTNSLVKSINKASKSERAMIYRSIYFFITVCCWILWRRIFKRPVLLLVWLVLAPTKAIFWNSSGSSSSSPSFTTDCNIESISSALTESAISAAPTIFDKLVQETRAIIEEIVTKDEL